MKTAIITGITGQDGSYLTELLLDKQYKVIGIKRRTSTPTTDRLLHLFPAKNFEIIEGDLTDYSSISGIVHQYQPDELYNLAAQSHVGTSFKQPYYTFQVDAVGVLNCLEAIRQHKLDCRFYQASTSELFGSNVTIEDKPLGMLDCHKTYQNEETPFSPNSPYAVAKLAAHNLVRIYRESYNIHASCGILFNHESPRRGGEFVTRKITKWIAEFYQWYNECCVPKYKAGLTFLDDYIMCCEQDNNTCSKFPKLRLGNIEAYRDWGHARDYINAMYLMLQQDTPNDFVIATGEAHSVKDFLKEAFSCINIDNWEDYIVIDPKFYRPCEVPYLCGDASKANKVLGWTPKTTFKQLVDEMVQADIHKVRRAKEIE